MLLSPQTGSPVLLLLGRGPCCPHVPRGVQDLDWSLSVPVSLVCEPHGLGDVIWLLFRVQGLISGQAEVGVSPVRPAMPCVWAQPPHSCPQSPVGSSGLHSKAVTALAPFCPWVSDHGFPYALAPCPRATGAALPLLAGERLWWEHPRVPSHVQNWCWPRSSLLLVPWLL